MSTNNKKIYMAKAKILHWGPNVTYIFHLFVFGVCVGGNTHFSI